MSVRPRKFTRRGAALVAVTAAAVAAAGLVIGGAATGAMPGSPTDEAKVPHYFGPYPNWANSPLAQPDATVSITGAGTGATADATVGANGAVTAIAVTSPGKGYTTTPTVTISGAGTGATARATIQRSGVVDAVTLTAPGAGYTAPTVTITGGNGQGALATASGGVDAVKVAGGGSGYTMPVVDFDLPDQADGVQATGHAEMDANGTITSVVVDTPGSGYTAAPGVAILDGTRFDPVQHDAASNFTEATATTSMALSAVTVDAFGSGYTRPPRVTITDPTGRGATATASTTAGAVTSIRVTAGGSGYVTGGIKKFVDTLPGLGEGGRNDLGQYIPVATPDTTSFKNADYYTIAVVQHRERMHRDLQPTLLREYVQLSTAAVPGKHVPLYTDRLDGTRVPVTMPDGSQAYGVDDPHYLGPFIQAQKDRAVRVTFYNLLPTGKDGDFFLPVDSTMMGSGTGPNSLSDTTDLGTVMDSVRNPLCTQDPKSANGNSGCFKDNRAELHLHGGVTPWISDGTPHQWITPAGEQTDYPQGVSVHEVPDMVGKDRPADVPDCSAADDGCQTFYYTNQQSARLMFYHDHSWGITRLNVYAGEAAGYVIRDAVEQKLIANRTIPSDEVPLVIQDKTFVPGDAQMAKQDPTWDANRWGGPGNLWYHHVYMPAQNPGDPSGMSAFGRWMYGPWFWPPATGATYQPIDNPYHDPNCRLDDPATWQYQTDPFCEPEKIPGTPNVSAGMEQFNDTPLVNGTAYPTTTLDPKPYRLRILNASNDRFWNLQWYVADTTGTEVALKPAEVAAAQTDPNVVPTPDTTRSPVGPSWIQIGTEGGFLPAPVVIPNQPITWITDPTRFDVGNVDKHSLLLAPAERADVIVDFSRYKGKTLILYNDAPAAFPARVACYDYYTGGPDLQPACAPSTLPGYGPNTRTVMQIKVSATGTATAFNLTALQTAFKHKANGTGVFESGQHPIIVGQAAYNSAYGTKFAASGFCSTPKSTIGCDGFARISQQGGDSFTFDTLRGKKLSIPLQPKAIHDEMNSTSFDEYGRMTANLGVESVPANPGKQNANMMPYTAPATEVIDATELPRGDVKVTPIAKATDGTQIWKITHNGVDTHPIHFHLYDVQVLNRVTWDNIVIPPDANELGWKDTVRVSPLEDTLVALRPVIPALPWELPNSIHEVDPMMKDGATLRDGTNAAAAGTPLWLQSPNGEPIRLTNHLVNNGWEYVWHCHILSHEEMDMMRPQAVAVPPKAPDGLTFDAAAGTLTWNDNSVAETSYEVQKMVGAQWSTVETVTRDLAAQNTTGTASYTDPSYVAGDQYRVVAVNTVGDTADYSDPANAIAPGTSAFPVVRATAVSAPLAP